MMIKAFNKLFSYLFSTWVTNSKARIIFCTFWLFYKKTKCTQLFIHALIRNLFDCLQKVEVKTALFVDV